MKIVLTGELVELGGQPAVVTVNVCEVGGCTADETFCVPVATKDVKALAPLLYRPVVVTVEIADTFPSAEAP